MFSIRCRALRGLSHAHAYPDLTVGARLFRAFGALSDFENGNGLLVSALVLGSRCPTVIKTQTITFRRLDSSRRRQVPTFPAFLSRAFLCCIQFH